MKYPYKQLKYYFCMTVCINQIYKLLSFKCLPSHSGIDVNKVADFLNNNPDTVLKLYK